MHTWKPGGTQGRWVLHSSATNGNGSDARGVGMGEDYIGPMPSVKMARTVAEGMTHAYEAGIVDAERLNQLQQDRIRQEARLELEVLQRSYAELQRSYAELQAVALSDITDSLG